MPQVTMETDGPIATVRLNRPEKLNAITPEMARDIYECVQQLNTDPNLAVMILCGAGDRAFCVGSDIESFSESGRWPEAWDYHNRDFREDYARSIRSAMKPVIAMIHGYCLGGGCDLIVNSDLRIAAEGSHFGAPEIDRGWFASGYKAQILPRMIGLGAASKLMLTGATIDADEAYRIGLLTELVPLGKLESHTYELARQIAAKPTVALQTTKLALRASTNMGVDAGFDYENELITLSFLSQDRAAGVKRFLSGSAASTGQEGRS